VRGAKLFSESVSRSRRKRRTGGVAITLTPSRRTPIPLFTWLRAQLANEPKPAARRPLPRLGLQQLEAREVPTVGLLSAFGVGSAADRSIARDIAVDAAGNSYLTGLFGGTVDFDPTGTHPGDTDILTAAGGTDAFVAKYAPDNSLVWAKRMGGSTSEATDSGQSIDVDGAGNVYVTGQFRGTADFGSTTLTAAGSGGHDGFVTKFDAGGSFVWANRWGLADNSTSIKGERGSAVDTDAAGNVYVLGTRTSDNGAAFHGYDILKYNSDGTPAWAKFIGSSEAPVGGDLATDAGGSVFVTGTFNGLVDFDPNSGTKLVSSGLGVYSGFVLKLTSAGNFGWISPFVGQSQTVGGVTTYGSSSSNRLVLDGSGNVIVGGFYNGKVDFDPGRGTTSLPTGGGMFITKLNSAGGFVWARALEDRSAQRTFSFIQGLAVDSAGSVYATGSLAGSVDFDPGSGTRNLTSAGGTDAFVVKLTSTGNFGWAESFGGAGDEVGWGIAVHPSGTVHLAGSYASLAVDFDPDLTGTFNLTNPGTYRNIFLVKLRQN